MSAGAAVGPAAPHVPGWCSTCKPKCGHRPPAPPGATTPGGTRACSQPRPILRMHWLLILLIRSILSSPGHVLSRDPDTGKWRVHGRMRPGGIWSVLGGKRRAGGSDQRAARLLPARQNFSCGTVTALIYSMWLRGS